LLSHARTLAGTHAGFPFSPESPNFLVFIGAKIECTQAGTCAGFPFRQASPKFLVFIAKIVAKIE
jgi:hypothetical protein